MAAKKASPGRALPRIVSFESYFLPPVAPARPVCCARITTEATISWRRGNERQIRKAEARGVDLYNCFMLATHQINGEWYCKKHAAAIALELLSEEAP